MKSAKAGLYGLLLLPMVGCNGSGDNSSPAGSTPGVVNVVNGYHLTSTTAYDARNRIVHLWELTPDYSEDQLQSTFTSYNDDGSVSFVAQITSFYDDRGRLTREDYSRPDSSDSTTYTFNETGLLSRAVRQGENSYSMDFSYDESSRLNFKSRVWTEGGVDSSSESYTYAYDSQGLLSSANLVTTYLPAPDTGASDQTTSHSTYEHDNSGRIIRREQITSYMDGGIATEESRITDFFYDENSNITEESVTGSNGVSRYVYTYERSEEPIFNTLLRRMKYFP